MIANNTNIIRGYAKAIFNLAKESNCCEQILLLLEFLGIAAKNHKLLITVNNNFFALDLKITLLFYLIKLSNLKFNLENSLINNLIKLLIKNKHFFLIPNIYLKYEKLYLQQINQLKVSIVSAIELNADQKIMLNQELTKYFNKTLELSYQIDPVVIAGIIIKYNNQVIDCSLKQQLLDLESKIIC